MRPPVATALALALALALAPALATGAQPPHPRVTVSAEPRLLELAPGAKAKLRITAPEMPLISVNVGEVQGLTAAGKGAFEATYVPPREKYPQVAVIAVSAGRAHAWLALPLAGTGEVPVKAGADGSASITIGKKRFGPQRAGPDGKALIRIVVPPGIRYGTSGGKRFSLNTPSVSHVYVTIDQAYLAADASGTVLVRAYVVTPEGKPRRNAPLQITASSGRVSAPRAVEPGLYESRWTLGPGASGVASVEARLGDEDASVAHASLQREAAQPRRLTLELDRPSVVVGEGPVEFSLVVQDSAGNPVDDVNPRATTNIGAFLGWTRGVPGRWTGRVSIPDRLDGAKLVIVASVGDMLARREVELLPGPTADLSIETSAESAGPASPVTLTVTTFDQFGNPTNDAPPQAKADSGKLGAAERLGAGRYRLVYRPPANGEAERDEITVKAGRAERTTRLWLGGARMSRFEVGVKGGGALRSGKLGPVVAGEASAWKQIRWGQLGLAVDLGWFRFSQSQVVSGLDLSSSASYLQLIAAPSWRHPLGGRGMIWASVGGGLAHVQSSSTLPGQPAVDESTWVAAGSAAVSVGLHALGGYPFFEVRGSVIANPKLKSLVGSFTPIFFQVGYRFDAL